MAILTSCVTSNALALYTPEVPRQQRNTGMSVLPRRRQIPTIGLTTTSCAINRVQPIRRATKIPAVAPGPGELPAAGNSPLPNIPTWAKWLAGAVFMAAPTYWKIGALQDKVEQTAEAAIEVVDKMAEAAEKIAGDVAESFPGNEGIKKAASRIKAVADEIEKDADKAEALLRKVDEIEEEVDEVVYSFMKKKSEKKNPQRGDKSDSKGK